MLLLLFFLLSPGSSLDLYNKAGGAPSSPCGPSARGKDLHTCLQAIRKRAEDPSLFWFGNGFTDHCSAQDRLQADCYNPTDRQGSDSVITRVLALRVMDPGILDRYLEVNYTTQPGFYNGCGNRFSYNQSREVTVDPLSMAVMTPYEVRAPPNVRWSSSAKNEEEGEDEGWFTLLFYDAGYFTVKALYVNIPGNNFTQGQAMVDYEGPLNPTRNNSPYVFLLFRQAGPSLTLSDRWRQIVRKGRNWEAELPDFITAHKLKGMSVEKGGPVAMNWVLVHGDAYAAEVARTRGYMNTCARFVAEAFQEEKIDFIPNKTYDGHALKHLNVYINVTFQATPTAVNSCCSIYNYSAQTFNVNPLGQATVLPAHTRTDAEVYVTLHMATAFPDTQRDFEGKTLTLIMADPDVPVQAFGNLRLPFLHWCVVNIRGGDVASGHAVQPYMGPAPPDPQPHRYYFLLFSQPQGDLDPARMDFSAANCSWAFRGRCRFDIMAMVSQHRLQLVGASWMVARHDEFVRDLYVKGGLNPPCVACKGVPGYGDPCPPQSSSSSSGSTRSFAAAAVRASLAQSWSLVVAVVVVVVVVCLASVDVV
ncbi:hypothetical protein ACOMHN_057232 [Nucella lapillus]